MSSHIIGLTGGIGSGKTAATDYLQDKGIIIVDADVIAREVVEKGSEALTEIAARFGNDILLDDGTLNRRALRTIIFNDKEQKDWLEALLHPKINHAIRTQLAQADSPYAILVSPLLLETAQKHLVDRIVVIDVDESVQIARATARDESNADNIKKIIASQMPRKQKQEYADYLIDNSTTLDALHKQLDSLHAELLEHASG